MGCKGLVFQRTSGSGKHILFCNQGHEHILVHSRWWCLVLVQDQAHTWKQHWGMSEWALQLIAWFSRVRIFYLQMGFPRLLTMHVAPGPHGDGLHGSGFSMHRWFWQTYPVLQSGSRTHSGPQPVMVSGLGTRPGSHLKKCKSMPRVNFRTDSKSTSYYIQCCPLSVWSSHTKERYTAPTNVEKAS